MEDSFTWKVHLNSYYFSGWKGAIIAFPLIFFGTRVLMFHLICTRKHPFSLPFLIQCIVLKKNQLTPFIEQKLLLYPAINLQKLGQKHPYKSMFDTDFENPI